MLATAAVLLLAVLSVEAGLPQPWVNSTALTFPHFRQCDPLWANNSMDGAPGHFNTICAQGCAMTSLAMAVAGLGVRINGTTATTPATVNAWLQGNKGYTCIDGDCDNLDLTAIERLTPRLSLIGETAKPDFNTMSFNIGYGTSIYIAHVRNKTHFVLLTAAAMDGSRTFHVNDPFFNQTNYTYDAIADVIHYTVNPYPLMKQCGSWFSNEVMGKDGYTICDVGCLLTSISMVFAGTNVTIKGKAADPSVLNHFLQSSGGYTNGTSALSEAIVATVSPRVTWAQWGMHTANDLAFEEVAWYLESVEPVYAVIANVMQGTHFVLVTGHRQDGDTLIVNDPGFWRNTYSYSRDVVGWRIFAIQTTQ